MSSFTTSVPNAVLNVCKFTQVWVWFISAGPFFGCIFLFCFRLFLQLGSNLSVPTVYGRAAAHRLNFFMEKKLPSLMHTQLATLRNPLDYTPIHPVTWGIKLRFRENKSLLKCPLSSYWHMHLHLQSRGAGSGDRTRKTAPRTENNQSSCSCVLS